MRYLFMLILLTSCSYSKFDKGDIVRCNVKPVPYQLLISNVGNKGYSCLVSIISEDDSKLRPMFIYDFSIEWTNTNCVKTDHVDMNDLMRDM